MRTRTIRTALAVAAMTVVANAMSGRAATSNPTPGTAVSSAVAVERGKYLVNAMGCHDCHTPWKMGPNGPGPDMSRPLSGHPSDLVMPPPPKLTAPWGWSAAATNTAFAGPWGVSFTANLTPDPETGLGKWTADTFIATMKTGRHEGKGRRLLPPMPYPMLASLSDEDIRSVFSYLQSLPPIRNRVPAPIDPPDAQK
ncbi:MAG: c-type cytochrome [Vicinamibacterales bacterium]